MRSSVRALRAAAATSIKTVVNISSGRQAKVVERIRACLDCGEPLDVVLAAERLVLVTVHRCQHRPAAGELLCRVLILGRQSLAVTAPLRKMRAFRLFYSLHLILSGI